MLNRKLGLLRFQQALQLDPDRELLSAGIEHAEPDAAARDHPVEPGQPLFQASEITSARLGQGCVLAPSFPLVPHGHRHQPGEHNADDHSPSQEPNLKALPSRAPKVTDRACDVATRAVQQERLAQPGDGLLGAPLRSLGL